MANVSISGAISGLDTASIINSLVAVQTNQQTLLKAKQTAAKQTSDAYKGLTESLNAFATQASKVADTSGWKGLTATASASSVTATATGTAAGSLTFDVTSVAKRHALVSAEAVGSTASVVAAGPLTLTGSDGTVTSIAVGAGTLDDVVSAVNAAGKGLTATAVQTAPGQYRLQVAASAAGATSAFTLTGLTGFTAMNVLSQGTDATIHVGDGVTGYDISSASNTFSGVVPGLSFTVSKLETGVTVSSSVDGTSIATDLQALVDSANKILSDVATKSAWDATKKTGGALMGQTAVRNLTQSILATVAEAGAPGISLTRDGKLTFDQKAFVDAFAADPAAVTAKFGPSIDFAPTAGVTGRVALVRAGDTAVPASYQLTVTAPPVREQWQVASGGSPIAGSTLTLARAGGATFSYTAPALEPLSTTVLNLNARLAAAGFGVGATLSGGNIRLTATAAGAGPAFTAALNGTPQTRLAVGADVAGKIDGVTATGSGNVLSLASTGSPELSGAAGLSLTVDVTAADITASATDIGTVTYSQGLAQKLSTLVSTFTGTNGALSTAKAGTDETVKDLQTQIDTWDSRLETYRAMLTRQFTAMETAMSKLKSATSFLTASSSASASSTSSSSSSS